MSIRGRLKALEARLIPPPPKSYEAEIARLIAALPKDADGNLLEPRSDAEASMHMRLWILQAGLPPADSYADLSLEDCHRVMEFHNYDPEGQSLELPVFSWRMDPENRRECYVLHGRRNRGEITPEEYRRRVRELAGLPPEEAEPSELPSGQSPPSGHA